MFEMLQLVGVVARDRAPLLSGEVRSHSVHVRPNNRGCSSRETETGAVAGRQELKDKEKKGNSREVIFSSSLSQFCL